MEAARPGRAAGRCFPRLDACREWACEAYTSNWRVAFGKGRYGFCPRPACEDSVREIPDPMALVDDAAALRALALATCETALLKA